MFTNNRCNGLICIVSGGDIFDERNSAGPSPPTPPRAPRGRFISSILGGDVPYGSRGHVLTRAERKEFPPLLPVATPPPPPRCHQVSVIQRTPLVRDKRKEEVKLPASIAISEPEQEQPIDYHIPKVRGEGEDEEEEKKILEQRRSSSSKIANSIIPRAGLAGRSLAPPGKLPALLMAAAGHGRSGGGGQGSGGQASSGGQGGYNGGTSGGSAGAGGGGALGGGAGGGGMGGRDGRSDYGPNSPPTGSLPPFYESLKGGQNGINAYNANGNFLSQTNFNMMNGNLDVDCDTGQTSQSTAFNENPDKQYSLLQNAAYGIVLKDETDLDYDNKLEGLGSNLSSYGGYDVNDSMMVDMAGNVMDPLQFTATLTFSGPAEHALLDSLSDAADLSNFLQRLPGEDSQAEIITDEIDDTPSLTPDSVGNRNDNAIDSFSDQIMMNRQYYQKNYLNQFGGHESGYGVRERPELVMQQLLQGEGQLQQLQIQVQMQQQGAPSPSPGLSFSGSGLDLDSPSTSCVSMPSPSGEPPCLSPASVSVRRNSFSRDSKIGVLKPRVSYHIDQMAMLSSFEMKRFAFCKIGHFIF